MSDINLESEITVPSQSKLNSVSSTKRLLIITMMMVSVAGFISDLLILGRSYQCDDGITRRSNFQRYSYALKPMFYFSMSTSIGSYMIMMVTNKHERLTSVLDHISWFTEDIFSLYLSYYAIVTRVSVISIISIVSDLLGGIFMLNKRTSKYFLWAFIPALVTCFTVFPLRQEEIISSEVTGVTIYKSKCVCQSDYCVEHDGLFANYPIGCYSNLTHFTCPGQDLVIEDGDLGIMILNGTYVDRTVSCDLCEDCGSFSNAFDCGSNGFGDTIKCFDNYCSLDCGRYVVNHGDYFCYRSGTFIFQEFNNPLTFLNCTLVNCHLDL